MTLKKADAKPGCQMTAVVKQRAGHNASKKPLKKNR